MTQTTPFGPSIIPPQTASRKETVSPETLIPSSDARNKIDLVVVGMAR